MRLGVVVVMAIMAVAGGLASAGPAAAQSACEFKLGFRAIAERLPAAVGGCLENEHSDPTTGDALQRTERGLLVWRKADNFTAFTDGHRTWVNGPLGLQQRLNAERFPWEGGAPAATGCVVSGSLVSFTGNEAGPNGSRILSGTAYNPCPEPIHIAVDLVEGSPGAETARPLYAAPTTFLRELPSGVSTPVTVRIPAIAGQHSYSWRVTPIVGADRNNPCLDVGADRCLATDAQLVSAVQALAPLDEGQWLLRGAARAGVRLQRGRTPTGVFGLYRPGNRTITIAASLDAYSSWVRAAVIAHELRHAVDHAQGTLGASAAGCYEDEESAFRTEARVWAAFWDGKLPPNTDRLYAELNTITVMAARDPAGLADSLSDAYHEQCG
jgi:hypothetical protein